LIPTIIDKNDVNKENPDPNFKTFTFTISLKTIKIEMKRKEN
jgi:hypothetical protein